MPNPNNIKPYADFAHEAAKHGGPQSYVNQLIDAAVEAAGKHKYHSGYTAGMTEGMSKGIFKGSLTTGIVGLVVCGVIGFGLDYHYRSKLRLEEERRLALEAEQAELALRNAVSQLDECEDVPATE